MQHGSLGRSATIVVQPAIWHRIAQEDKMVTNSKVNVDSVEEVMATIVQSKAEDLSDPTARINAGPSIAPKDEPTWPSPPRNMLQV